MGGEFVGPPFPGQTTQALQAAVGELVEVALDAAAGDVGQARDVLVGQPPTLQPQDLHFLLDAGMRVVVAFVAEGNEVFGREGEAAHGKFLCS